MKDNSDWIEKIITEYLDDMPNYEEYMVNSTMKVLVSIALHKEIKKECIRARIKGMRKVMYSPFPHNKFEDEITQLEKEGKVKIEGRLL